jgi:acyl-coenzyme A thioesterase PaaI-like protein
MSEGAGIRAEVALRPEARAARIGRHFAVVDCDVRDNRSGLVSKALMTFFVGPFPKNREMRRG